MYTLFASKAGRVTESRAKTHPVKQITVYTCPFVLGSRISEFPVGNCNWNAAPEVGHPKSKMAAHLRISSRVVKDVVIYCLFSTVYLANF